MVKISKNDRIGGEIKAMIQCPNGYIFVGVCLSSNEFIINWLISGLIGDLLILSCPSIHNELNKGYGINFGKLKKKEI